MPEELNDQAVELTTLENIEATFHTGHTGKLAESGLAAGTLETDSSRYDLILQVGAGAMGEVYLAQDTDLLRKVAYKRLLSGARINSEVIGRFLREVQITAQLEHPNVVPVYNLEKSGAGWAYAMKLVFGQTFKELIVTARAAYDGPGPVPDALQTRAMLEHFLKVCEAMDFSHQRGVIHRDLKPANIMVGRYHEVYVMDWGIARMIGSHDSLDEASMLELSTPESEGEESFEATRAGQILGTPRYLSPEQAAGRNTQLDGRSDLLTLGLILYELVSLKPAYSAPNLTELLKQVLKTEKAPLKPYHPKRPIPRELAAIIHKATARKPEARYQRVAELAADLRRHLAGKAVLAQPDTHLQALLRWFGQHQVLAAGLVGSLILILALGAVTSLWNQRRLSLDLQRREQSISRLQTRTSRQAQLINNKLMGISALLQGLSAAASEALAGKPVTGPLYREAGFISPGQAPADFKLSQSYAKMISLDWPVFGQAGGAIDPQAFDRLKGLRAPLRTLLRRSSDAPLTEAGFRAAVYGQGLPVVWSLVALEQGSWLSYPGQAGYPADFDPRRHAWYQRGLRAHEPVWAQPHPDSQGQGLLLPVVQSLRGPVGEVLGVAALELRFQYLVDELMNLSIPGLLESYLLDGSAQIMVRSSERSRMTGMSFGAFRAQQAVDTPLFDRSELVEAIKAGRSGFLRYLRNGRPVLLAYYRLSALGWFYALEVEEETYLAEESGD
ncbi:MAG TPA: serine/threonine protein kinase [Candidatus Obscuribacterales bacterium]